MDTIASPARGAKEGQDLFALHIIGPQGFFLDLGCGDPVSTNNTVNLEAIGWRGMAFDNKPFRVNDYNRVRKSPAYCIDLGRYAITDILKANNAPRTIDFISFDVDEATLGAIELFPWEEFRFRCMCFEHDLYTGVAGRARKRAMEVQLLSRGYSCLAENVCFEAPSTERMAFEDWWIDGTDTDGERYKGCFTHGLTWQEQMAKLVALG